MADVSQVPELSVLAPYYGRASYQDCFSQDFVRKVNDTPVGLFVQTLQPAPLWVRVLMGLRNWVVGFFGLKKAINTGVSKQKAPEELVVGDYIGFFKITNLSDCEIVVTANDNHLDTSFSFYIENKTGMSTAYITSVVQTKRRFGDVYMRIIAPFHRLIVRRSMKRLV